MPEGGIDHLNKGQVHMNFQQKLENAIAKNNSLVCIGLDTEVSKIPKHLFASDTAMFDFNKAIVDRTADLVCCYKANSAFYEAAGAEGIGQLKMTFDYIKGKYPDIPLILDAKRGDIGNTNEGYVTYAFGYLKADAITLSPYLGADALEPFLTLSDKGLFIVCRTSNPGASEFQDLMVGSGDALYLYIAKKVINEWNANNNCMLVAGVTRFEEIKELREITPAMFFLVPGVGAQGGDLFGILKHGLTKGKSGLIIHSARGIIYASAGLDFADAARKETEKLRDEINQYR